MSEMNLGPGYTKITEFNAFEYKEPTSATHKKGSRFGKTTTIDKLNKALKNGTITNLEDDLQTISSIRSRQKSMFAVPQGQTDRKKFEVSYSPERSELLKRMKQKRDNRNSARMSHNVSMTEELRTRNLPSINKTKPGDSTLSSGC